MLISPCRHIPILSPVTTKWTNSAISVNFVRILHNAATMFSLTRIPPINRAAQWPYLSNVNLNSSQVFGISPSECTALSSKFNNCKKSRHARVLWHGCCKHRRGWWRAAMEATFFPPPLSLFFRGELLMQSDDAFFLRLRRGWKPARVPGARRWTVHAQPLPFASLSLCY